ncbi:MAG: hypothetical protein ACKN94_09865 [Pirellulaceae bacterium]
MNRTQWNWYATQELADSLRRDGIRCPRCQHQTQEMDVYLEEFRFHCRLCGSDFSPADFHAASRRSPKTGLSTLYRPIGEKELAKIAQSGFTEFPPRVQWQPIFYPVLTQDYADAIARDWNSTDPDHNFVGYVTRFQIRNEFLTHYEIQAVADKTTLEYWIPAEDLDEFNRHLVGKIEVIAEFRNGKLVPSTTP